MTNEAALKKAEKLVWDFVEQSSGGTYIEDKAYLIKDIAQAFTEYEQKLEVAREALEEIACMGLDQRPRARIALEKLK